VTGERELLSLADRAVDRVIPALLEARGREDLAVHSKSSSTDMVTEMDEWAETVLTDHIRSTRPDDGFLGEEGTVEEGTSGVVWLIDPIDGTTNYLYDLPGSSVSVAAAVHGEVVAGVVHDLVRNERFRAIRDGGATLDHAAISVSGNPDLGSALIATGFSYDADRRKRQASVLVEVLPRVRDIRRFGGAAIDLCSVACGRVDGYYERGLNPWDHAAGALIANEAGARVDVPDDGAVVAATPEIFEELSDLIRSAGAHQA
jgi:myo-inositol-1(or 4)-monophosphatase